MSSNTTEGIQSYPHEPRGNVSEIVESFVESTAKLAESLDAPEERVSDFEESGRELAQLVEGIAQESVQARESARTSEARVEELEAELKEERQTRAKEAAQDRKRLHEVEERLDSVEEGGSADETPTPEAEETALRREELTPIERLSTDGDVEDVTTSASVERAVEIFDNIQSWGTKVPKGYTIRPEDNPLALLEAARDESLSWRQWYRAAETLEQLSKGAVTFFDSDRHGKTLVLHEQSAVHERVTSGSLTASSVGATT